MVVDSMFLSSALFSDIFDLFTISLLFRFFSFMIHCTLCFNSCADLRNEGSSSDGTDTFLFLSVCVGHPRDGAYLGFRERSLPRTVCQAVKDYLAEREQNKHHHMIGLMHNLWPTPFQLGERWSYKSSRARQLLWCARASLGKKNLY